MIHEYREEAEIRTSYIEESDIPFCDEATKYKKVAKIGQGTFG
jgi:hypothetical protein